MRTVSDSPADHLTLQFLTFIAAAPRSYGEAMEAWQTTCPRMTIWEDAVRQGLVEMRPSGGPMRLTAVVLTGRGRAWLAAAPGNGESRERATAPRP
jgi:hypothetical protein